MINVIYKYFAFVAFPQQCFYQGEQYSCGVGMNCWMQGKRPVDLCSGGVLWSCCVPYAVQTSPAGVIKDPGMFVTFIHHYSYPVTLC